MDDEKASINVSDSALPVDVNTKAAPAPTKGAKTRSSRPIDLSYGQIPSQGCPEAPFITQ